MLVRELTTDATFGDCLNKPTLLLFIYSEVTNPARKAHDHLINLPSSKVEPLFAVQPWQIAHAREWIYNQPKLQFRNSEGNLISLESTGALAWLRNGAVVDVERDVQALTTEQLVARSNIAFKP
jgi:hypothetical protein